MHNYMMYNTYYNMIGRNLNILYLHLNKYMYHRKSHYILLRNGFYMLRHNYTRILSYNL